MTSTRPSLAKGFIAELDGLRGLAILLVMVHRFWPRTSVGAAADIAGAGWIGVDLFFVISGFLIAGILLDTRGDDGYFRNFYARRALRIFPLYYLFVVGVFVAFAGNPGFREGAGSPLWYLFHLGNVPEGLLGNPVPYWLAPTWSLAIEEQFYLTFPLLVYFLDRRKLAMVLVGMIAVAPVIRTVTMLAMPEHERVQYLFTLCRIDTIAVGCLLAIVVRTVDLEQWRLRIAAAALVTIPCAVALAVASGLDRTSPFDRVFGYSIVAVGCASVVALVVLARGERVTAPLRWAPLAYVGKLCFGLYLLHRPADTIVSAIGGRVGFERQLWLMPVKIVVALMLATLSWRLLERPFLHLKDRFASARHPSAAAAPIATSRPGFVTRALRMVGILIVVGLLACERPQSTDVSGDAPRDPDGSIEMLDANDDAPPSDAPPSATGVVLYPEGVRHSPITPSIAARLQAIAAAGAGDARVFAKIGDSITASADFVRCFDGGTVDLGAHATLASTIAHFRAGDAAGGSPFVRESVAARGGTTARDAVTGTPSPLDSELAAVKPRFGVVLFGTNEVRYGHSLDDFGASLWELVDEMIARGVVPILSTMPANVGYPEADAKIPTFNRAVRAIAQGRGVPLVDLHHAFAALPNRGISSDGLHPSVSPNGGCVLTSTGLQYGYNVRNLLAVEALERTRAALAGMANDNVPTRAGSGSASDPYVGRLPLVDLADTRDGGPRVGADPCNAPASGREIVYRVEVDAACTVAAEVVDRGNVDVDVRIVQNDACRSTGTNSASAAASAGTIDIVVTARTAATEGEYLLVVERR